MYVNIDPEGNVSGIFPDSPLSLVIPAGYSFNLDGTSIYLSMAAVFIAQVFKVPLTLGQQLTILGVLMLTSKGAAGVTGSGFIVLTSTLTAMRVVPVEGVQKALRWRHAGLLQREGIADDARGEGQ